MALGGFVKITIKLNKKTRQELGKARRAEEPMEKTGKNKRRHERRKFKQKLKGENYDE